MDAEDSPDDGDCFEQSDIHEADGGGVVVDDVEPVNSTLESCCVSITFTFKLDNDLDSDH